MADRTISAIGADLEALDALLAEVGGDVSDEDAAQAVDAWFAELGEEAAAKLDRLAFYVRDLEARAGAKKAAAADIAARGRQESARAAYLRAKALDFVRARGGRLDAPVHRFTVVGNGGPRPVRITVEPQALPVAYRDEAVTYAPRTDEIRRALEAGQALPFAELGERGEHLRIR